ncbi:microsomal glutathione S-transferase 1-like [Mytilus edulis]|uniref:microsomal glutathione S-transferase 1-like n=1 Tax=Mytilus edulis TaxID=6550 RepID=UPI0039EF5B12
MALVFSLENPVVGQFVLYASIVLVKMMIMSFLTIKLRRKNQIFLNPEDLKLAIKSDAKIATNDPDIERVRRCHLNDLENIIPFVLIGSFYCLTGPDPFYASLHFRLFAGFRLFHSVAYLMPLPQPSRGIGFLGGWFVTFSMAMVVISSLLTFI